MKITTKIGMGSAPGAALATLAFVALLVPGSLGAQEASYDDVTFTHDITPILQRSCQNCHREGGVAPMTLVTYQQEGMGGYSGRRELPVGAPLGPTRVARRRALGGPSHLRRTGYLRASGSCGRRGLVRRPGRDG